MYSMIKQSHYYYYVMTKKKKKNYLIRTIAPKMNITKWRNNYALIFLLCYIMRAYRFCLFRWASRPFSMLRHLSSVATFTLRISRISISLDESYLKIGTLVFISTSFQCN